MNMQQLQAKYGKATTTQKEVITEEVPMLGLTGWFGKTVTRTVDASKSTVSAVGGVMPATNRRVDDIAAKFNTRMNNVEMNQRVADVKISMIAQATGVNLPADEEIIKALLEEDKRAEEISKIEEAKVAEVAVQAVAPMMEKMMEAFTSLMQVAKKEVEAITDDEIYEIIEEESSEVLEVKDEEPAPKKETKKDKRNRRRVKRGAPLAE